MTAQSAPGARDLIGLWDHRVGEGTADSAKLEIIARKAKRRHTRRLLRMPEGQLKTTRAEKRPRTRRR